MDQPALGGGFAAGLARGRPLPWASAVAVAVAGALALLALAGWMFSIAPLRGILPGAVEMKANAAIGLLLDAGAIMLLAPGRRTYAPRTGHALSIAAAAIGLATLLEYRLKIDLGIDELLFNDASRAFSYPGRMSPFAALAFIAMAVALVPVAGRRSLVTVRLAGACVLAIGAVSTLGYAWNARELTTDRFIPPMAINTAIALIVLGVAALRRSADAAASGARSLLRASPAENRIVAALCGVLLLLFLAAGWMYRSTARFDAAMAEVARIQEIRATLAQLYAAFSDAESAQRHYLLTADDEQRDRHRRLSARVAEQQAQLAKLLADAPAQQQVLAQLDASVTRSFAILDLELKRFEEGTFTTRAQLVTAGLSDPARMMTHTSVDRLDALEAVAQQRLEAQATQVRQHTLAALLAALAAATSLGALLFRAIGAQLRARDELRRFDAWGQRAMALFTSTLSRARAIHGTLELLGEMGGGGPVGAAFYALDEDGSMLTRVDAAGDSDAFPMHAAPAGKGASEGALQRCLRAQAAIAETSAGRAQRGDPRLEVQLLACPVGYLEQNIGVLAVATPGLLRSHETAFVRRMASQLGVTLHNLRQYSDLMQISAELTAKNEALRRQAADLEKGSQTKSEFLATMSHELRTPLNAIIGFAEALHENLVGDVTAEQREYIGDILGSGEHLLELINDILDLSKVEAGKMVLRFEPEDVRPILDNALTMVRERAHSNRVQLAVVVDRQLPMLWLDSRRLKQILFNLLGNAVKFTPEGGRVRITASCAVAGADATLHIAVSDTGIGISPADQARLFQPFMQIDSSLGKRFEGTGLGLAMVKRLAALHGGSVSVVSAPGEGSTFAVELPCRIATPDDMYEAAPMPPVAQALSASASL